MASNTSAKLKIGCVILTVSAAAGGCGGTASDGPPATGGAATGGAVQGSGGSFPGIGGGFVGQPPVGGSWPIGLPALTGGTGEFPGEPLATGGGEFIGDISPSGGGTAPGIGGTGGQGGQGGEGGFILGVPPIGTGGDWIGE